MFSRILEASMIPFAPTNDPVEVCVLGDAVHCEQAQRVGSLRSLTMIGFFTKRQHGAVEASVPFKSVEVG